MNLHKLILFIICSLTLYSEDSIFEAVEFETTDNKNSPIKIKSKRGSSNGGIHILQKGNISFSIGQNSFFCSSDYVFFNANKSTGYLKDNVNIFSIDKNLKIYTKYVDFDLNKKFFHGQNGISLQFRNINVTGSAFEYNGKKFKIEKNVKCTIKTLQITDSMVK